MKQWLVMAFSVFLATGLAFAISSNDAVNFVVNSNNFLYESETYTPPNVAILFGGKSYWVIPLTAGNNIITYFPVEVDSGAMPESRAVNRGLFGTADSLRELQLLKASISANPAVDWIFTQKYQTIFSEMSIQLGDEVFQLNTVESTLKTGGVKSDASSLKNSLTGMAGDASLISESVIIAANAENNFATNPSPESFEQMNRAFRTVFEAISSLNSDSLSYRSELDRLKQQISTADIDAQTKSQLFAILEVPDSLQALRGYNLDSTQIRESLDSAFKASSLRMDSVLEEFENRLQKNRVHGIVFGGNSRVAEETEFLSLAEAQAFILSPENRGIWESQSKLRGLEQNYQRAVKFYDERSFAQAERFALAAADDAVAVLRAGRKQAVAPAGLNQDFLFQVAGILVILLAILYIFNNRGRLRGIVSREGEEINVYR